MNVDFRCEHCGKLLSAPAHANEPIRCPHCQKLTAVPAGLASLPHPKVDGASASPPPPLPPGAPAPEAVEEEAPPGEFVGIMERAMPFVISLFFHLSLVLVFLFVTSQMMTPKAPPGEIVVPSVGVAMPGEEDDAGGGTLTPTARPTAADTGGSRFSRITESSVRSSIIASPGGSGGARPGMAMIGVGGATGGNSTGTGTGSGKWFGGGGGGGGFFGLGGRGGGKGGLAKYVVYVIDRSGSMLSTFDAVRFEMLKSIGDLDPRQNFHVIFFSEGAPVEPVEKRLVPANSEFKAKACEGLRGVFAKGQTDPIPALTRAFDVLDKTDVGGKVLYLLTDAAFPDNQKVIDLCKSRNGNKKDVHIYTFLYGDRPKEAEDAMKKIAADNGGKYKFVSAEE